MICYVASPLGFTEAGREFSRTRVLPLIEASGHVPIDPWALVSDDRIAEENRRALDAADVVVAVLDGSDVDRGTAAEIGAAGRSSLRLPISRKRSSNWPSALVAPDVSDRRCRPAQRRIAIFETTP